LTRLNTDINPSSPKSRDAFVYRGFLVRILVQLFAAQLSGPMLLVVSIGPLSL
jgi:hypothetical protein